MIRLLPSLLFCLLAPVIAAGTTFPADVFRPGYFVDITAEPYRADPTGKEDCGPAIQQAISDLWASNKPALKQRTIFFPKGTYRIVNPIRAVVDKGDGTEEKVHRLTFLGESRDESIIRLDANAAGFDDPKKPREMIRTESIGNVGYDAYDNNIWNLTLDVGAGNPGAVGIDYHANNTGSLRNLRIVAPENSGFAGILFTRVWPGPSLIAGVEISGFDYGIDISRMQYSLTIDGLTLSGQRVAGIRNVDNAVFIRHLTSDQQAIPAITNTGAGLLVLLDSKLKGASGPAVISQGGAFLRDIDVSGYDLGVENASDTGSHSNAPAGAIAEYVTHAVLSPDQGPGASSLRLPGKEIPEFTEPDLSKWQSVGEFTQTTGMEDRDQAEAVQAAFDAAATNGKTVVYFPPGQYTIGSTIRVHGGVRQVLGFGSVLRPSKSGGSFEDADNPKPAIEITDITGPSVEIDRLLIWEHHTKASGFNGILDNTDKPVVIRNVMVFHYENPKVFSLTTAPGAGDLFLDSFAGGRLGFMTPGQRIWARQLNPEARNATKIINTGAKLSVLGLKTERPGLVLDSSQGALTEILGGFFHPVSKTGDEAILRVDNSSLSASYVSIANSNIPDFANHVLQIREGKETTLTREDLYPRKAFGNARASLVPLVVVSPGAKP